MITSSFSWLRRLNSITFPPGHLSGPCDIEFDLKANSCGDPCGNSVKTEIDPNFGDLRLNVATPNIIINGKLKCNAGAKAIGGGCLTTKN